MNKKKIGIVTHYYKSYNYGGNLQAYALCEFLNQNNYDAEQIAFIRYESVITKIKKTIIAMLNFVHLKTNYYINKRKRALLKFNKNDIRHSKVYKEKELNKINNLYDAFITGSDQVWHPSAICGAYLLNFANEEKIKLSYAASISKNELTVQEKEMFKKSLKDYNAISVRENKAIELLQNETDLAIEKVLDPTLLLDKNFWNNFCEEKKINDKYLFCYFLGENINARNIATEYAKKHNLKIVTLPNLLGTKRQCDKNFGDIKLYDVNPRQFAYLIKHSELVFTDSFHGSVFSLIFEKELFIFNRDKSNSMSSRIYDLCNLFDINNHFCDTIEKCNLNYINKIERINYNQEFKKFNKEKQKSIDFLINNLGR